MKKKIIAAACLAAVMAFTGCANNETSSNNSSTSSSTKSSGTEESSSKSESSTESSPEPEESSAPETNANEADFEVMKSNDGSGSVYITKYNGSDENVVIPETIDGKTVVGIGKSAFKDNKELTSVTIPDSVEWISSNDVTGAYTAYASSENSFFGCTNLKDVTFLGDDAPLFFEYEFSGTPWLEAQKSENPDCLVVNNTLIAWRENEGDIVVPNGINKINTNAFWRMDKITSIGLPAGVTEIGASAFQECAALKSINIPDGVTKIGNSAFLGCLSLKNIIIPDSVKEVDTSIFDGTSPILTVTYKGETYDFDFSEFFEAVKQNA